MVMMDVQGVVRRRTAECCVGDDITLRRVVSIPFTKIAQLSHEKSSPHWHFGGQADVEAMIHPPTCPSPLCRPLLPKLVSNSMRSVDY
eukprot:scaffold13334_cov207-Alexandrium_tamarense.AAC.8